MTKNAYDPASCSKCGTPGRKLWPPVPASKSPEFEKVISDGYIELIRCNNCNGLWCRSYYEPYSAFQYSVKWELSEDNWKLLDKVDGGKLLSNWHILMIRSLWQSLSEAEKEFVENHRKRTSYSQNPIDGLFKGNIPDLKNLIERMKKE